MGMSMIGLTNSKNLEWSNRKIGITLEEGEQLRMMGFVNAASVVGECIIILLKECLPLEMNTIIVVWVIAGSSYGGLPIL